MCSRCRLGTSCQGSWRREHRQKSRRSAQCPEWHWPPALWGLVWTWRCPWSDQTGCLCGACAHEPHLWWSHWTETDAESETGANVCETLQTPDTTELTNSIRCWNTLKQIWQKFRLVLKSSASAKRLAVSPVAGQVGLGEKLSEQHAVCHVLEHCSLWCAVLKTNAVAHLDQAKKKKKKTDYCIHKQLPWRRAHTGRFKKSDHRRTRPCENFLGSCTSRQDHGDKQSDRYTKYEATELLRLVYGRLNRLYGGALKKKKKTDAHLSPV